MEQAAQESKSMLMMVDANLCAKNGTTTTKNTNLYQRNLGQQLNNVDYRK